MAFALSRRTMRQRTMRDVQDLDTQPRDTLLVWFKFLAQAPLLIPYRNNRIRSESDTKEFAGRSQCKEQEQSSIRGHEAVLKHPDRSANSLIRIAFETMAFRLPGRISNPLSRTKSLLMAAFAYSRHWNVRNLECYWYGPVGEVVSSLVDDIQELVAVSQPFVWYKRTRSNVPIPANHDPDTSVPETIAAGSNSAVIPDFGIYFLKSRYRNRDLLPQTSVERIQKHVHIDDVRLPLVVEAKRYAKRSPTVPGMCTSIVQWVAADRVQSP
ncbi:hypothetical protein FA95DRAFT_564760 [Auriscalpium vulgare]|uniref:Uncharacterized protein n=1 Tax=Auriscalpium vulgare TaxID=40419 RepID=A0ACB8REY4_9AGAM|nr:hypothetical protein FA95DRAFT_564760 [Auriscalpium vulgare]